MKTIRLGPTSALTLALVVLLWATLVATAGAAPRVTGMEPREAPQSGGMPTTITGTELDKVTRVAFGPHRAVILSKTPTAVTVRAPMAGSLGGITVTISDDVSQVEGGVFNFNYYKIAHSVSPQEVPEVGGTEVVIWGRNLDRITRVLFCGRVGTILAKQPTALTVRTPRCSPGGATIDLGGPDFGSDALPFSFSDVPTPPAITSLSPDRGPTAGGTAVTVSGAYLGDVSAVMFGATPAAVSTKSDASLTFTTPPGAAGASPVTFTNGEGSTTRTFTYVAPPMPPTVTSLSPDRGPVAGGTAVTLTGTDLDTTTSVTFGTAEAAIGTKTANTLTLTVPSGVAGPATVTVTTPEGAATTTYVYEAPGPGPGADPGPGLPAPFAPVPPSTLLPALVVPGAASGVLAKRAPRCSLALKGRSLAAATSAIKRSGCRVGAVRRPRKVKKGTKLVVSRAALAKGSTTKVDLTLRAKRR